MTTMTIPQARAAVNAEIKKILDTYNENRKENGEVPYDASVLKEFLAKDDRIFAKEMREMGYGIEDGRYSLTPEDVHKIATTWVIGDERSKEDKKLPLDYHSEHICENINSNIESVWNDVSVYLAVLRGDIDESELDKEITRDSIYDALIDNVQAEYNAHQDEIFIGEDKRSSVRDTIEEIMDDIDEFTYELSRAPESLEYAEGEEKEESLRDKIERLKASPAHTNAIKETSRDEHIHDSYSEYSEP